MATIWINTATGEIVDEEFAGAIQMEVEDEPQQEDKEWLGDWLTKEQVRLNAEEAALKKQHATLMARVKARRSYLSFAYNKRLEAVVFDTLLEEGGKRQSVQFAYGPAGFRKSTKTEVFDEEAAKAWAEVHAPDAIKVAVSLLKGSLPKGEDVPGVRIVKAETFYVSGAK